jgi:putative ABC transport system ATP-binding protein
MIKVSNLYKIYETPKSKQTILDNINLDIKKGELVLLMGVSGSGKSTLLSILSGANRPTSGEVLVDGELISKLPDMHISHFRASKVGMVFQSFNLLENLTAIDNIIAPLVALNLPLNKAVKMAQNALENANISHHTQSIVANLSGGEKQRVAIARAIVNNPKVLFCDEPTANLDRENSLNFIALIEKLNKMGITVVVATHDTIFEELKTKYRTIYIEQGKIVE